MAFSNLSCGYLTETVLTQKPSSTTSGKIDINLSPSSSIPLGTCHGPISVRTLNDQNVIQTQSQARTIALTYSGSGTFYSDSSCQTSATSVTIPAGQSSTSVYFMTFISEDASLSAISSSLSNFSGTFSTRPVFSRMDRFAGDFDAFGCHAGSSATAKVASPFHVSSDGTYLYISSTSSHTILRQNITTGQATVLAGTCFSSGSTDGVGTSAKFNSPYGTLPQAGILYVADRGNHVIRQIDLSTNSVSVFAGTVGSSGTSDGMGTAAKFNNPSSISTDGTYLYVTDGGNNSIRKIQISNANVTTLATGFSNPRASTVQGGFLWVVNYGSTTLHKVDTSTGTAGSFFTLPNSQNSGITSDSNYLYVSNYVNYKIQKISFASPAISDVAGSGTNGYADGSATSSKFSNPHGLWLNGTDDLYVADTYNHLIRKVSVSTGNVSTQLGTYGTFGSTNGHRLSQAKLGNIGGYALVDKALYFSDWGNQVIRKIDLATGTVSLVAGGVGVTGSTDAIGTSASFNIPQEMATDGTDIFIADKMNHKIRKLTLSTGAVTTLAGTGSVGSANGSGGTSTFSYPTSVTYHAGSLYIADGGNHTIRKLDLSNNTVSLYAGTVSSSGTTNHTNGLMAKFYTPISLTNDGTYIYVADKDNNMIRTIDLASSSVSLLAGSPAGSQGSSDGMGTAATFKTPLSISYYGGYIYIVDSGNSTIRRLRTQDSNVSTLAGQVGMSMDWADEVAYSNIVNPLAILGTAHGVFVSNHMNIKWIY